MVATSKHSVLPSESKEDRDMASVLVDEMPKADGYPFKEYDLQPEKVVKGRVELIEYVDKLDTQLIPYDWDREEFVNEIWIEDVLPEGNKQSPARVNIRSHRAYTASVDDDEFPYGVLEVVSWTSRDGFPVRTLGVNANSQPILDEVFNNEDEPITHSLTGKWRVGLYKNADR